MTPQSYNSNNLIDSDAHLRLQEQNQKLIKKCQLRKRMVLSYKSAVEILTKQRNDERSNQQAKDQIIEQYMQHTRQDHNI